MRTNERIIVGEAGENLASKTSKFIINLNKAQSNRVKRFFIYIVIYNKINILNINDK